eukprot:CAMPEP_0117544900 /NCGR_PEP_ID=MMETSP0784-20121206/45816_1 /TAXON_ID=39447 /ORGANISM="" /LENGTH=85 /DNA_ID=CAMNT_0005341727 /DNA_START=1301 /DNA_END=1555 /DNA_ORIENTATION=+
MCNPCPRSGNTPRGVDTCWPDGRRGQLVDKTPSTARRRQPPARIRCQGELEARTMVAAQSGTQRTRRSAACKTSSCAASWRPSQQ